MKVGALLWIASALLYVTIEAWAASPIPGYDYLTDYISTLGDPVRSPRAELMNAAFVVQAIAFPLGAWLVSRRVQKPITLAFFTFAVVNGAGNVLVATVHSGAGAVLHPVGAALAIAGGNLAVLTAPAALRPILDSRAHRVTSIVLGGAGLLCLLAVALGASPIGLWERVSVDAIFGWQAYTGAVLLHRASSR